MPQYYKMSTNTSFNVNTIYIQFLVNSASIFNNFLKNKKIMY